MHLMKYEGLTRRNLLAGIAGGAALTPLLPMLDSHAQTDTPTRFIVFNTPHGLAYEDWLPSGGENNWALSPVLEPLAAHKDQLTIVSGLSNQAVLTSSTAKDHKRASRTLLTGTELTGAEGSGGPSIDQEIASGIGATFPHESLQLGVLSNSNHFSSSAADAQIACERDPQKVFDSVFSDFTIDDSAFDKLKADRKSVLQTVRAQLASINTKIAASDRHKIEAHLDGIAKLEDNLANLGPLSCKMPDDPTGLSPSSVNDMVDIAKVQIDLLVAAMSCGLTNVGSLVFQGGSIAYNFLGINEVLHDCCHQGSRPNRPLRAQLISASIWWAEMLAYLLDQLAGKSEGGGTMLDNTLVVWCTFMSNGSHDWNDMPITLAGGAGGNLQPGRHLSYSGRALNDLWLSCANLVGHDINTFGNPDYVSGPLPGLV